MKELEEKISGGIPEGFEGGSSEFEEKFQEEPLEYTVQIMPVDIPDEIFGRRNARKIFLQPKQSLAELLGMSLKECLDESQDNFKEEVRESLLKLVVACVFELLI